MMQPSAGSIKTVIRVQLREEAPGRTQISIRSRLLLEHLTVYTSELQDDSLQAYMRQELFRKICINLLPEARRCTELFPDYHMVSVSCPVPAAGVAGASDTADAPGRGRCRPRRHRSARCSRHFSPPASLRARWMGGWGRKHGRPFAFFKKKKPLRTQGRSTGLHCRPSACKLSPMLKLQGHLVSDGKSSPRSRSSFQPFPSRFSYCI